MAAEKNKAGKARRVRLFVEGPLAAAGEIGLTAAQAHYLAKVMRLKPGDSLAVFNGRDGEWRATLAEIGRADGSLEVESQTRPQTPAAGPALLFAPLKPARTALLIEKACEMGARELQPVATQHAQGKRFNLARHQAHVIEAAEQCGRLDLPILHPIASLADALGDWPAEQRLMFCDETGGPPAFSALTAAPAAPWAILVGPEGGFSDAERDDVKSRPYTLPVSLGPRLLRGETAAIAALSLWQAAIGDLRAGDSDTIS